MLEILVATACFSSSQEACQQSSYAYYMQSSGRPEIERRLSKIDKRLIFIIGAGLVQQYSIPLNDHFILTKKKTENTINYVYTF